MDELIQQAYSVVRDRRLAQLTPNMTTVWFARNRGASWRECGDLVGLTRERARQLYVQAERIVLYGRNQHKALIQHWPGLKDL